MDDHHPGYLLLHPCDGGVQPFQFRIRIGLEFGPGHGRDVPAQEQPIQVPVFQDPADALHKGTQPGQFTAELLWSPLLCF